MFRDIKIEDFAPTVFNDKSMDTQWICRRVDAEQR
jgi:hypothetical protein